jgi:hypothetical protein
MAARIFLSPEELQQLSVLADIIIPRSGKMPSASDIDLAATGFVQSFVARPDLLEPVRKALAYCSAFPDDEKLQSLSRNHPDYFSSLMQIVAGAYYMRAEVRVVLGYDGQTRSF